MSPSVDELCDMAREFGFDDVSRIRRMIEEKIDYELTACWSRGTWWTWVKNRAMEIGIPSFFSDPDIEHPTAELHVFSLSHEETQEQLERLKNENAKQHGHPARSRLASFTKVATPIDAVACRVAPTDGLELEER